MNDDRSPRAAEPASVQPQERKAPRQRILVVDDERGRRQINATVLIQSGYEVETASDGAAAWVALNIDNFDLLITDNNMPELTGVQLLRKMRSARMALPVIMATATLPKEEFARSPWLEPAATLLKPYSARELLGTVKEVLRATDSGR